MANFVSDGGKWYPAKERIALKNESDRSFEYNGETIHPGQEFIYEGPDREALREINISGGEHLGYDFRSDPEFLQSIRNMNFPTVEKYLKSIGYDEAQAKKKFEEMAASVQSHEIPRRVKQLNIIAGGKDTTGGGNDFVGGFGEEELRKPEKVGAR